MKNTILYLWQLPQNLLGFILELYYNAQLVNSEKGIDFYASKKMNGGISLGKYVILSPSCATDKEVYAHEYGHTKQSKYLGWLYLLVIGIPSILRAMGKSKGYYNFYTERWANHLGGLTCDINGRLQTEKQILHIPMQKIQYIINNVIQ